MHNARNWGNGAEVGAIYHVREARDLERVGNGYMNGRLQLGDWLICLQQSGDCFYDYGLLHIYQNGLQREPGVVLGAYTLGAQVPLKLSLNNTKALMAGEFVSTNEAGLIQQMQFNAGHVLRMGRLLGCVPGVLVLYHPSASVTLPARVVANSLRANEALNMVGEIVLEVHQPGAPAGEQVRVPGSYAVAQVFAG